MALLLLLISSKLWTECFTMTSQTKNSSRRVPSARAPAFIAACFDQLVQRIVVLTASNLIAFANLERTSMSKSARFGVYSINALAL